MSDATEVPMCACGDAWHEHNAANHAPTCRVLAAFNALTRERDAAREELRDLNEAWCVLNDSHIALRAERDEARVVTDAMVERVARVILSRRVSYTGKNAEKAWLWYGNDFKHEAREYLTAALSEAT